MNVIEGMNGMESRLYASRFRPQPTRMPNNNTHHELSPEESGIIAGIIIGSFFVMPLMVLILGCFLCICKRLYNIIEHNNNNNNNNV